MENVKRILQEFLKNILEEGFYAAAGNFAHRERVPAAFLYPILSLCIFVVKLIRRKCKKIIGRRTLLQRRFGWVDFLVNSVIIRRFNFNPFSITSTFSLNNE
jgi:predicted transcriptional regulator